MPLTVVTAPPVEPVTLAEAKAFARIDSDDDDDIVDELIAMATEQIQQATGRCFVETAFDLTLRDWPNGDGLIRLPRSPVLEVVHVKYLDAAGDEQTLVEDATDGYYVDLAAEPCTIEPVGSWPSVDDHPAAVTVRFRSGYQGAGSPTDYTEAIPKRAKVAIMTLVAHFYEQREPVVVGTSAMPIPAHVDRLLAGLKVWYQR